MGLNTRASTDARHARTGKDAGLYNEDGVLLASVESFQSKATFNNVKYRPLGQAQELETTDSYGITLTFSEIVIEDGELFNEFMKALQDGETPVLVFDGVIQGRNGSQERVTYRECLLSGDNDIQNVATGDVIKRAWSLFVNGKPEHRKQLSI